MPEPVTTPALVSSSREGTGAHVQGDPIAAGILGKIFTHVNYSRSFMETVRKTYRMYRAVGDEKRGPEPGRPNANTGTLEYHRCMKSVGSAVDAVMFGDDPFYLPWSDESDDASLKKMRNTMLVMDQQHIDMGLRVKAMNTIEWGMNLGTAIVYMPWKRRHRWKKIFRQDQQQWVYRKTITTDRPEWKHIPIWRFHSDLTDEMKDATWASFETEMRRDELQELINSVKDVPGVETRDLSELSPENGASWSEGKDISESLQEARGFNIQHDKDLLHVDEYWGIHPTKTNPNDRNNEEALPVFYRIVIVNSRHWVIQMPNPYHHGNLPFLKVTFLPDEENYYGIGMGDLVEQKYRMINFRRNLMTDILTMSLFGMWLRRGAQPGKTTTRIKLFPGKVFDSILDGIMEPIQVNTSALKPAFQMDAVDIEEMRAATAATANIQGLRSGADTATEVRSIGQEAARRIATFAIIFANQVMREFLENQALLNAQFLPPTISVAMTGPEGLPRGKQINKSEMFHRPRMKMKVAADLEFRKAIIRNLNQTLTNFANILQVSPEMADVIKPLLIQLTKKAAILHGQNPFEAVTPEGARRALASPQPQVAAPGAGPQGVGLVAPAGARQPQPARR